MREVGNRRYRLERELGRGGMGAVWLGKDTVLGREVAVKELLLPVGVPAQERAVYQERVLREARIASQLQDPAVVTVYDLISEDDQTFIVMELINAPTLESLVENSGPLSTRAAATLAGQLLNALEAAHASGVVHRDVKPGNVMVPGRGTAKLTDFGIAQSVDDPRLTATGTLIGSPAYMSPERLAGGEASPAWDLWALGATLFFAVEGRGAFDRPTTSATILAVMSERPVPQVAGPLGELIVGLMEPDPARRLGVAQAHRLIERAHAVAELYPARPPAVDSNLTTAVPTLKVDVAALSGAAPTSGPVVIGQFAPAPVFPVPPRKKRPVGLILSATLVPLFLVGALVLLYFTVFKPMFTNMGLGVPDGPASTAAMQPVLTLGPDGDIKGDTLMAFRNSCLTWLPAKDAPKIQTKDRVGCYAEHDVELLDTVLASTEIEKDVAYPGAEQLTKLGGTGCTRTFLSAKVNGQDKEKTLRYWVIIPTAEAWKVKTENGYRSSSRLIHCFVGKADGTKLTEPLMKQ
ncbi:Serine/threonine protein kinase [Lentzea waywayandensis]|uniref:non-specific serine/threonine protein kinase n=1 Tax=Lentzea waywayandensis TaxID=84724 RepID=A0A1I6D224_9PSEU|nr:serine/threonine-protein kinase [Lentzea waywayandensis]SFQ99392.1 Serine/threonine protein kinase [Lentzea waywayandensis]